MAQYMDGVAREVLDWVTDRCVPGSATAKELYAAYAAWRGERAPAWSMPSMLAFGIAMTRLGATRRKSNGLQFYNVKPS